MEGIELDQERRRLDERVRKARRPPKRPAATEPEILAEAGVDANPQALRAQVRLWQSKHELSRERLLKLWLLYEDARREIRGLRRQLERLEAGEEHARAIIRAAMDQDDSVAEPRAREGVAEQFLRWDEPEGLEAPGPPAAAHANGAFNYGPFTLYELSAATGGSAGGTFYFFSRNPPRRGTPASLPDGYEVELNPVNGLPYVRKAPTD